MPCRNASVKLFTSNERRILESYSSILSAQFMCDKPILPCEHIVLKYQLQKIWRLDVPAGSILGKRMRE